MYNELYVFSSLIHVKVGPRGGHGPMAHNVATRLCTFECFV